MYKDQIFSLRYAFQPRILHSVQIFHFELTESTFFSQNPQICSYYQTLWIPSVQFRISRFKTRDSRDTGAICSLNLTRTRQYIGAFERSRCAKIKVNIAVSSPTLLHCAHSRGWGNPVCENISLSLSRFSIRDAIRTPGCSPVITEFHCISRPNRRSKTKSPPLTSLLDAPRGRPAGSLVLSDRTTF